MSKIVYLLGAGASYGKRGEKETVFDDDTEGDRLTIGNGRCPTILEGVPIVTEIPQRLAYVVSIVKVWLQKIGSGIDAPAFQQLVADFEWLQKESARHATIDTFAKKLYLTGNTSDYQRLKRALSIFLVLEQIWNKPDGRYDAFLASILGSNIEDFPKNISILSWNYDCQIELAYSEYCNKRDIASMSRCINEYNKLTTKQDDTAVKNFNVIKLNGTALMNNGVDIIEPFIRGIKTEVGIAREMMSVGGENSLLSFAWENLDNNFENQIVSSISDADIMVVIGYSFPYFNRQVDRLIFNKMPNLEKIYIQDPNADRIKQNIQPVLSLSQTKIKKTIIQEITATNQFFLPSEL